MIGGIRSAFVLGAGLGTRLRPLTDDRPKPLVPVFHKPLITFAFDHLRAVGVENFVVNTHHCPEAYDRLLGARDGEAHYAGTKVTFRHEPILLDTAGGIGNVHDLLGHEPFLVHNGDVLADLPLDRLIAEHIGRGNVATLALRSHGGPAHVQFNAASGRVTDIRGMLGGQSDPGYLFTGISILSPGIFPFIPSSQIYSVIPVFLEMINQGEKVGGVVLDEGLWFDLGTRESYLEVHRLFFDGKKLSYPLDRPWPHPVHPTAQIGAGVDLEGICAVGAEAEIASGAQLKDSIIWERAKIASSAHLDSCIVRDGRLAEGTQRDADL